jgi:hypothetical protein
LNAAFTDLFGAAHVHDLREADAAGLSELDQAASNSIWVVAGHFPFGSQDKYLNRQKIYIATIRDPLQRFLSHYEYIIDRPDHPAYVYIQDKSPEQVIRLYVAKRHPLFVNDMSRTLGISSYGDIVRRLERDYAVVMPLDRVDDLIERLHAVFGSTSAGGFRLNASSRSPIEVDAKTARMFLKRNKLDTAAWEYAKRRAEGWLQTFDERMYADGGVQTAHYPERPARRRWSIPAQRLPFSPG